LDFSKFMVCPHGQGGDVSQCGLGEGAIFSDFMASGVTDGGQMPLLAAQLWAPFKKCPPPP